MSPFEYENPRYRPQVMTEEEAKRFREHAKVQEDWARALLEGQAEDEAEEKGEKPEE